MNLKSLAASPVFRAWLVAGPLLLMPIGRMSELPMGIMTLWAVGLWIRQGRAFVWQGNARIFSIVFLLFIAPMTLALLHAVELPRALNTVLTYPRLYLAGLFIIYALQNEQVRRLAFKICAYIIAFWVVDGLIQVAFGRDLLGNAYPSRVTGPFIKGLTYGVFLPILAPILLEYARLYWSRWLLALSFVLLTSAVLLGGSRAGWIMYGIVLAAYWFMYLRHSPKKALGLAAVMLVAAGLSGVMAYHYSPKFAERVDATLPLFQMDYSGINEASAERLPIWRTALNMIAGNPMGVGPRGFRFAYDRYAAPGDFWVAQGQDPTHPHQLYLEVTVESGFLGLAALITALVVLWRAGRKQPPSAQQGGLIAFGFGLLAAYFPINTTMAIYSAGYSLLVWWVTAMYCAYMARHS